MSSARRCRRCGGSGQDPESHYRYTTGGHDDRSCRACHGDGVIDKGGDHYYEIFVKYEKGGGYYVYYRSEVDLNWLDVPEVAVVDGDLHTCHLNSVESVMEITPEEYFNKMWE